MEDPQILAADQIFNLAHQNGLTNPELYHFARDFLMKNGMIGAFSASLINNPPQVPFDDPEDSYYSNIQSFMIANSLLPAFYTYLLTVSPPIPPLP